jgi:Transposase DDE domain
MSLLELFVEVDDFCQAFEAQVGNQQLPGKSKRGPASTLSASELMTIVIDFHQEGYRTFKDYYLSHVCQDLRSEFPNLPSYNRFVELMSGVLLPLIAYLQSRYGECSGISFVDSTALAVCHNRRIRRHKVFKDLAARGKTSVDWFFGFKLHLIVNDQGELLAVFLTPGNVDDRDPLPQMTQALFGKLFGDRGYVSQRLFEQFFARGLELITSIRKTMKNSLMKLEDKLLLRKRHIIETINDQLKNISQIEHTRHRKPANFAVNLIAGLIAYTHQSKKPSLNLGGLALPVAV